MTIDRSSDIVTTFLTHLKRMIHESRSIHAFLGSLCLLLQVLAAATALGEPLDREVVAEINRARTNPRAYASFLREFRRQYQGKNYRLRDSATLVRTVEGVTAVDEAIAALSRQRPQPPLAWSDGLAAAAAELAVEQGESGATGHDGVTSGGMRVRIERHGAWSGEIAENIGYGPGEARAMVMQLIVDDGVPGRGHRKNIFHRSFGMAAAACGPHPRYGTMCVIDFAGGFR